MPMPTLELLIEENEFFISNKLNTVHMRFFGLLQES